MLEAHRLRQAQERTPDWRYFGLVFVTTRGEPYHQRYVLDAFHDALDRAGIAPRRFHDLRGTSATLMADLAVPEHVRMSRLGHSTTSMARRYAKASEEQDRDAVERLGRMLG
jgi:integrase